MGANDLLSFDSPTSTKHIIKVIGVGGGGSNAVNYMYRQGIEGVDFMVCNTDNQALTKSPVPHKLQLGATITEGLGAGSKPETGKQAAIESHDDISRHLSDGTKMVFITAGMGGGTGTGAAPIIAKVAQELDILTVGIVTLPFKHEGFKRIEQAHEGLRELEAHVDALLVISNDSLMSIFPDLPLLGAFNKADDVLTIAAKGIAEIITRPGLVNTDFADVNTVMRKSGVALMGSARASGANRATDAIESALECPLLNNNDIRGAKNVLVHLSASSAHQISMEEFSLIMEIIQQRVGYSAEQVIHGISPDEELGEEIQVTVVATGFGAMANTNPTQTAQRTAPNAPQGYPNAGYGGQQGRGFAPQYPPQYGNEPYPQSGQQGYPNSNNPYQGGGYNPNSGQGFQGQSGYGAPTQNQPQSDDRQRFQAMYGRSTNINANPVQSGAPDMNATRPRVASQNIDDEEYMRRLRENPAFSMLGGNTNPQSGGIGTTGIGANGQFISDLPFLHDNKD